MSDEYVLEWSVIYRASTLTDFQKKVAAASIAIQEPVLVRKGNRGTL